VVPDVVIGVSAGDDGDTEEIEEAEEAVELRQHKGDGGPYCPDVLVVAPTRELCMQIRTNFKNLFAQYALSEFVDMNLVIGGVGFNRSNRGKQCGATVVRPLAFFT
jgi:superfamily II DNA/RNA helicase